MYSSSDGTSKHWHKILGRNSQRKETKLTRLTGRVWPKCLCWHVSCSFALPCLSSTTTAPVTHNAARDTPSLLPGVTLGLAQATMFSSFLGEEGGTWQLRPLDGLTWRYKHQQASTQPATRTSGFKPLRNSSSSASRVAVVCFFFHSQWEISGFLLVSCCVPALPLSPTN